MKPMRFLLLLSCSAAFLCGADLTAVRSVYVMPMTRGFDQYLANSLAAKHTFQVVTDPKLADAVFTDRLGEGFLKTLEGLTPAADTEPAEKDEEAAKSGKLSDQDSKLDNPALKSSFGRAKGTVFLVDIKSREVVWSTFDAQSGADPKQMDRKASDVVSRLMRDLKK